MNFFKFKAIFFYQQIASRRLLHGDIEGFNEVIYRIRELMKKHEED